LARPALAASPSPKDAANVTFRLSSSFAFADFDGDRQPDLATAEIEHADSHLTRYRIRLQFKSGSGTGQSIGVTGSFGLPQISALDVNGDHVPDLVLTAAGQDRPIAVLLNDGRGRFSLANPSDFSASLVDSPSRWRPASGRLQDIAVLVLVRAPQVEAPNARQSFAPQPLAAASISTNQGLVPDSLRSAPLGRAPPLFS